MHEGEEPLATEAGRGASFLLFFSSFFFHLFSYFPSFSLLFNSFFQAGSSARTLQVCPCRTIPEWKAVVIPRGQLVASTGTPVDGNHHNALPSCLHRPASALADSVPAQADSRSRRSNTNAQLCPPFARPHPHSRYARVR